MTDYTHIQITRRGCLAVHLMPEYQGEELERAVARIMEYGPDTDHERIAVMKANADKVKGPKIKTRRGGKRAK